MVKERMWLGWCQIKVLSSYQTRYFFQFEVKRRLIMLGQTFIKLGLGVNSISNGRIFLNA